MSTEQHHETVRCDCSGNLTNPFCRVHGVEAFNVTKVDPMGDATPRPWAIFSGFGDPHILIKSADERTVAKVSRMADAVFILLACDEYESKNATSRPATAADIEALGNRLVDAICSGSR